MIDFEGFLTVKEKFYVEEMLVVDYAYIIFPLAEKGSLLDFILNMQGNGIHFTLQTAICLFGQIILNAKELKDLNNLSHLDIKPDNFVFNDVFELLYIDLGFARTCSELTNSPSGTDLYLAPEVRTGKYYDPEKTDVFNIGIVLFIILYQILPFSNA